MRAREHKNTKAPFTSVRIMVPATTANLGPGFDTLGAALKLYNEVHVLPGPAAAITVVGEGAGVLPTGSANIVWQAMARVLGPRYPFGSLRVKLVNRIPLSSGMGSSAAARLGGLLAAYAVRGETPVPAAVLATGVRLEGHPDNIVPAMAGGLCAAVDGDKLSYVRMLPRGLKVVVCHPAFELPTEKARKMLPRRVTVADAVYNVSRTALFMAAVASRRYDCLATAMDDRLHQPYRKKLIPGMDDVFAAARRAGAYGTVISGAGPSLTALTSPAVAGRVARAMQNAWKERHIDSTVYLLDIDTRGARIHLT